jgi:hypothetical protein
VPVFGRVVKVCQKASFDPVFLLIFKEFVLLLWLF